MNRPTRREAIQTGLAGMGILGASSSSLFGNGINGSPSFSAEYSFHYDHVVGTSLDVWLTVDDAGVARAIELAILDEIERLRLVFSPYDPSSEISWLNRSPGTLHVSPDMFQVLRLYEIWQKRTGAALNGQLGNLVQLWQNAGTADGEPDAAMLEQIIADANRFDWALDEQCRTITRPSGQPLNLNAIAKGYIIDRAVAVAREQAPALRALLVNLGGDLRLWNQMYCRIGLQNPDCPEENSAPLSVLRLRDAAVATSGGYLRNRCVNGAKASHLIDPRTGLSAQGVLSATVVADDNVTANALATSLCVLAPERGLSLVAATPGVECLIVAADGKKWRSARFKDLEAPFPSDRTVVAVANVAAVAADDAWPEQFQVSIAIELPKLTVGKYRRPYVAVWVENAEGKPVKSIAVWGNAPKYLRDLYDWWKFAQKDQPLVKSVSRATRAPGKYTVVWDGKNDKGEQLPQGEYTIKVEVHREHGKHLTQSGKIKCGSEGATITLEKNAETEATVVEYGKKK